MKKNYEAVLRYIKIIQMMDNQIEAATELMQKLISGSEQIICFHLHTHLLYNEEQRPGEVDAYQDYIDPSNGITNGQVIMIQTPIGQRPLSVQEIKDMIGFPDKYTTNNPANRQRERHHPPALHNEVKSGTFKLDIGISAAVLQVIVDGYKSRREQYVQKLQDMGVNLIFTNEEAIHTPEIQ